MSPWPGCGPPAVAQHTQHTQGRQTRREANNPSKTRQENQNSKAERDPGSALLQLLAVPGPNLGSWLFLGCLGMTPLTKVIETSRGKHEARGGTRGENTPLDFPKLGAWVWYTHFLTLHQYVNSHMGREHTQCQATRPGLTSQG